MGRNEKEKCDLHHFFSPLAPPHHCKGELVWAPVLQERKRRRRASALAPGCLLLSAQSFVVHRAAANTIMSDLKKDPYY